MRIKLLSLFCCFILLVGCSCDNHLDFVVEGYQLSREHFDEEAWKDHIDYCEYTYTQDDISLFKNSDYYHEVTKQDVDYLKDFVEDFSDSIQWKEGYQQWYQFNKKKLNTDDYFYLRIIDPNEVYGEYHCYDLFYFDVSERTLYYMSYYK